MCLAVLSGAYNILWLQVPDPNEDGRLSPSVTLCNPSRLSHMDHDGGREEGETQKNALTPRGQAPFKMRETSYHDINAPARERRPYKQPVSLRRNTYTPRDRVCSALLHQESCLLFFLL